MQAKINEAQKLEAMKSKAPPAAASSSCASPAKTRCSRSRSTSRFDADEGEVLEPPPSRPRRRPPRNSTTRKTKK
ncbi:MAG: hypothetical protein QM747_17215 [Nocardioides sp.]